MLQHQEMSVKSREELLYNNVYSMSASAHQRCLFYKYAALLAAMKCLRLWPTGALWPAGVSRGLVGSTGMV